MISVFIRHTPQQMVIVIFIITHYEKFV